MLSMGVSQNVLEISIEMVAVHDWQLSYESHTVSLLMLSWCIAVLLHIDIDCRLWQHIFTGVLIF